MNVSVALLADYANVSSEGKLNVMGVFDRIWAPRFPVAHINAYLVLRFNLSPVERGRPRKLRITLINEDGLVVNDFESMMVVPEDTPPGVGVNQVIRIETMLFERPGTYAFHISIDGDTKADIPFNVSLLPDEPGGL